MCAIRSLMVSRFPRQLGLEVGHLADGVLVEQFLEARLETRQVVGPKLLQHFPVFARRLDRGVDLLGFQGVVRQVAVHGRDDLVAQPG